MMRRKCGIREEDCACIESSAAKKRKSSTGLCAFLILLLFLLPGLALAQVTVRTFMLDAFVQRDGMVRLDYQIDLVNTGTAPLTSFPLSLPSSKFDLKSIKAVRCDRSQAVSVEAGSAPAEQEGAEGPDLGMLPDPDTENVIDVSVDLSQHPVQPRDSARLCVSVPMTAYVVEDNTCPGSAYVTVRPILYGSAEPVDIYVAIHLPEGIDSRFVLGQQDWPQNEQQYSLPVRDEDGHAVIRWSGKKVLHEIYWISAIFPGEGIQKAPKYDGLQTGVRSVPKEVLHSNVYIQESGLVKVVYEMELENLGSCLPIESVQFVLTGQPLSVSGKQIGEDIPVQAFNDIYDSIESHLGQSWYQAYNARLKYPLPPAASTSVRVEAELLNEILLEDPAKDTGKVLFGGVASSSGYWSVDSRWITRVHLPPGIQASHAHPQGDNEPSMETQEGHVVITWEQTGAPKEVSVSFPLATFGGAVWSAKNPAHWLYVIKNFNKYHEVQIYLFIGAVILSVVVLSFLRKTFGGKKKWG